MEWNGERLHPLLDPNVLNIHLSAEEVTKDPKVDASSRSRAAAGRTGRYLQNIRHRHSFVFYL